MTHRGLRCVLGACACWAALAANLQAQELLGFGLDKGRIAKIDGVAGSAAVVTFAGDYLEMNGPNYWDSRWQFNKVGIDLCAAEDTDVLVLEVQGVVKDERPWIRLMLCSPDWKDKAYWRIDLTGMTADGWTTVVATTPINAPLTQEGRTFSRQAPVGNVMFYAKAEKGNNPWQLRVRSLSLCHAAEVAKLTTRTGGSQATPTPTVTLPAPLPDAPLLSFGSAAGKVTNAAAGIEAAIALTAGYLQITGKTSEAIRCQCLNPTVDLRVLEPTDHLQIELAGEAPGEQPTLQLMLLTPDGLHGSAWTFDLSGLKKDHYTLVSATTPMSAPTQRKNDGFHQDGPLGSMVFSGAAKASTPPWSLRLKALRHAPVSAVEK